jgi:DNA-binding LytR/AlgR family response regulator
MNILLIEDESAAAKLLKQMVLEIRPDASILAVLDSVKSSIQWLREHPWPDLIISDIQLADGNSFAIFQELQIEVPVIFTTAYDEHTLKAFKLNSIDYLLKPIEKEELQAAIAKFEKLHQKENMGDRLAAVINELQSNQKQYKSRFLVKLGDRLITVSVDDIAYLHAEDKIVFLHTIAGQRYIVSETLDELERTLNPTEFFRLNRGYIAPLKSIDSIHSSFAGKLKVILKGLADEVIVSKEKAGEFKRWLDR